MTRSAEDVQRVRDLAAQGLGARRIARETGIGVTTIQRWLSADPEAARRHLAGTDACEGSCDPTWTLPTGRYSYLLGIYLGDGHIAPVRRSFRLSIACDARYAQVNHAIEASVGAVSAGRVSRYRRPDGCLILSAAWRHWPCVFPQHGRGRKHDRQIRLEAWQQQVVDAHPEAFLRGLIHSDGSRVVNKVKKRVAGSSKEYRYLRYFFSNRSSDIRTLFCDTCDRLGLRWRADGPHNITINHQSDIAFVDTFVGPKA